jgi:hypothetical protein
MTMPGHMNDNLPRVSNVNGSLDVNSLETQLERFRQSDAQRDNLLRVSAGPITLNGFPAVGQ